MLGKVDSRQKMVGNNATELCGKYMAHKCYQFKML